MSAINEWRIENMKKSVVTKLAILVLATMTLAGCILIPVDDGYNRGEHHDNGRHRGEYRNGPGERG